MKKLLYVVCCCLLSAVIISGIRATRATNIQQPMKTTVEPAGGNAGELTVQEMAQQSQMIITGQCLNTRSMWVDRSLVTVATISVGETIKGEQSSTVSVVLPGGADANRRIPVAMTVPGAASIQPQEQVLLFLTQTDQVPNSFAVTGHAQGKFSIVQDDQGQKMVSRDLTRVPLKRSPGVVRGNVQRILLSEIKGRIKESLR